MSECKHGDLTAHGRPCPWCKNAELEQQVQSLEAENAALQDELSTAIEIVEECGVDYDEIKEASGYE